MEHFREVPRMAGDLSPAPADATEPTPPVVPDEGAALLRDEIESAADFPEEPEPPRRASDLSPAPDDVASPEHPFPEEDAPREDPAGGGRVPPVPPDDAPPSYSEGAGDDPPFMPVGEFGIRRMGGEAGADLAPRDAYTELIEDHLNRWRDEGGVDYTDPDNTGRRTLRLLTDVHAPDADHVVGACVIGLNTDNTVALTFVDMQGETEPEFLMPGGSAKAETVVQLPGEVLQQSKELSHTAHEIVAETLRDAPRLTTEGLQYVETLLTDARPAEFPFAVLRNTVVQRLETTNMEESVHPSTPLEVDTARRMAVNFQHLVRGTLESEGYDRSQAEVSGATLTMLVRDTLGDVHVMVEEEGDKCVVATSLETPCDPALAEAFGLPVEGTKVMQGLIYTIGPEGLKIGLEVDVVAADGSHFSTSTDLVRVLATEGDYQRLRGFLRHPMARLRAPGTPRPEVIRYLQRYSSSDML